MLYSRGLQTLFLGRAWHLHTKPQIRSYTSIKNRSQLIRKVYAPFFNLPEGSAEFDALADGGTVWEEYFKPYNIEPYLKAQSALKESLNDIDRLRLYKHQDVTRSLVTMYSHENAVLGGNLLS